MIGQAFIINLANTLGIPLGAKYLKGSRTNKSQESGSFIEDSRVRELLNTVIDITKDDVCVGETPLFYKTKKKRFGKDLREKVDNLTAELNRIISGAAVGILKKGYAVYTYTVYQEDSRFIILRPVVKPVEIFLDYKNDVKVYNEEGVLIENVLAFLFYEEDDLQEVEDTETSKGMFKVNPKGLQTKNAKQAMEDLSATERAIQKLRGQMRYIRFATVEVGLNQGDKNQEMWIS